MLTQLMQIVNGTYLLRKSTFIKIEWKKACKFVENFIERDHWSAVSRPETNEKSTIFQILIRDFD